MKQGQRRMALRRPSKACVYFPRTAAPIVAIGSAPKALDARTPLEFFLPQLKASKSESEGAPIIIGGKDIVFVVDNDAAVRESTRFWLELEGLIVRTCATAAQLLQHADLPRARCLVLDAQMPFTDTFEILDLLSARRDLPVILLTSNATSALGLRAAAAGVRFVLEKPLLDNSLLIRIQAILGDTR